MNNQIIVVGAGVSGLTCAVRLLEAGFAVRVIAAELPGTDPAPARRGSRPPGMCSKRAAAIWYPFRIKPEDRVRRWGARSLAAYRELAETSGSGVRMVDFRVLHGQKQKKKALVKLDVCGREMIKSDELPSSRYAAGVRIRVPFIDTTVFLPSLEAWVRDLGGTLEHRAPLRSLREVRGQAPVVVNCTGLGARRLCHDERMRPERGQVLYARAPAVERWSVAIPRHGDPIYVFPRTSDVVLGGTDEVGIWDERTDETSLDRIQDACCALEPALQEGYEVLGSAAGLRPVRRGGVRLEPEHRPDGLTVIHNYGHGGAGYTVAWGCADEVTGLVKQAFGKSTSASV